MKLTSVPVLQGMAWTLAEPSPAKELVFSAFFGFKKKKKSAALSQIPVSLTTRTTATPDSSF